MNLDVDGWLGENEAPVDYDNYHDAVDELERLLDREVSENQLQAYLTENRYLLGQMFQHCYYVFPRVNLGSEYEADYFCLDQPSSGIEWYGVEIECSTKQVITKSGRKRAELEHALQQVRDWRSWVRNNMAYAQRRKGKYGIGLEGIHADFFGYVIIGRRKHFNTKFEEIRQDLRRNERIEVRSWDSLVEHGRRRADVLGRL